MSYTPSATQTTEPTTSQTVESAALEFRTLKNYLATELPSLNSRVEGIESAGGSARAMRVPADETLDLLPAASARANTLLGFDANGAVRVLQLDATDVSVIFTAPVVESYTVAVGQSEIALTAAYEVGANSVLCYADGALLRKGVDWNEVGTSGTLSTAVQLLTAPTIAYEIDVIIFSSANVGLAATLASYQAAYPGAVVRSLDAKLREAPVSAADFTSIQAALSTGRDVYLPEGTWDISSELTFTAAGQQFFGSGYNSYLRLTGTLSNVISATSLNGCGVSNMRIRCNGDTAGVSYLTCNGVLFRNVFRGTVRDCTFENAAGSGVALYNSDHCSVTGNRFTSSAFQLIAGSLVKTSFDIAVVYSSNRNLIANNIILSSGATGIGVQSLADTDVASGNVITGNIIYNARAYGIIAYRNVVSAVTGKLEGTVIANNYIRNVLGDVLNPVAANYSFGAGIYVQGAEYTTVIGNNLRDTHSSYATTTFSETLAPGAIGTTNVRNVVVANNIILSAGMFGIDAGDPLSQGLTTGRTHISGNLIVSTRRSGIHLRNAGSVSVKNNEIVSCLENGIHTTFGSVHSDLHISGNTLSAISRQGINIGQSSRVTISGNKIALNPASTNVHGIVCQSAAGVSVTDNDISGVTLGEGVRLVSCSDLRVNGVTASLAGLNRHGVLVQGCTTATVSDVNAKSTGSTGSGEAAAVAIHTSTNVNVSNVMGHGFRYAVYAYSGDGIIANVVNGRNCSLAAVNIAAATNTVTGVTL